MSIRKERRRSVANARNNFGEVVSEARYGQQTTIVLNRAAEAAAIVSIDFYRRALVALGETAEVLPEPETGENTSG